MKQAIGFIEYRSVARGIAATDAMLKGGDVSLVQATILCPGKFVALVAGDVGAVEAAVQRGFDFDWAFAVGRFVLPNVHPSVLPALTATTPAEPAGSFGVIETIDASTAIVAGDTAAKAGNVELLEIRIARGMGGKSVVFFCGDLAAVEASMRAVEDRMAPDGVLIATSIIASPHPAITL